jgi:hypothetical protein
VSERQSDKHFRLRTVLNLPNGEVRFGLIVLKNSAARKSGRKSRILFLKSTRPKTLFTTFTFRGKIFRRICLAQRDAEFFNTIRTERSLIEAPEMAVA